MGLSPAPTLVFTIVIAQILRDRFSAEPFLIGGLILYTLINTMIPCLVLRMPPEEYDAPEAPNDKEVASSPR